MRGKKLTRTRVRKMKNFRLYVYTDEHLRDVAIVRRYRVFLFFCLYCVEYRGDTILRPTSFYTSHSFVARKMIRWMYSRNNM